MLHRVVIAVEITWRSMLIFAFGTKKRALPSARRIASCYQSFPKVTVLLQFLCRYTSDLIIPFAIEDQCITAFIARNRL